MPIQLRLALRLARDATLARRMEQALAVLEAELPPLPPKPKGWFAGIWWKLRNLREPWDPEVMRRTFVRHPLAYRTKFALGAMFVIAGGLGEITFGLSLPLAPRIWLLVRRTHAIERQRAVYLARCEYPDVREEIERRLLARGKL